MKRNFWELLKARWRQGFFVCVGLDSEAGKIPRKCQLAANGVELEPAWAVFQFNKMIVDATARFAAAFKPNFAFYEALGRDGIQALIETVKYINQVAPAVPVILDFKRGDIGNTNNGSVTLAFDEVGADAVTLNPYLGEESLKPFLARADKGIIILCRTSNPGGGEFQDLMVHDDENGETMKLYEKVAKNVARKWNKNKNCAVVVGATCPEELERVRKIVGDMLILIPGVGAQGGDLIKSVAAGMNSRNEGFLINASRSIIFKSSGNDFDIAAGDETEKMSRDIETARVLAIMARSNAIIKGDHFVYQAGEHGPDYVNKAALVSARDMFELAMMIARRYANGPIADTVIAPAEGALGLGELVALALSQLTGKDVRFVWASKEKVEGGKDKLFIGRDFPLHLNGLRVLVVEDVFNSGGSAKDVVDLVRENGGEVIGVGALCNRGKVTTAKLSGVPRLEALMDVDMPKYPAGSCPLCEAKVPVNIKLGHGKKFLAEQTAKQNADLPAV